jgi:hypothetical protein
MVKVSIINIADAAISIPNISGMENKIGSIC